MCLKMSSAKWRPSCIGVSNTCITRVPLLTLSGQIFIETEQIWQIVLLRFKCKKSIDQKVLIKSAFSRAFGVMKGYFPHKLISCLRIHNSFFLGTLH